MKVAAELRLKHGTLWELCHQAGGTKALGEAIGIGHQTVHAWLHMRRCPVPGQYTKWYTEEVERRLEELAGVPASELFPSELKDATTFFAKNRVRVAMKDIEPAALLTLALGNEERLLTHDPVDDAIADELTDKLEHAMSELTDRERFVLDCRYRRCLTLEETGKEIGTQKERVRQIEAKAIRKLQQPTVASELVEFLPDNPPNFERLDREFERRQNQSLRKRYEGK